MRVWVDITNSPHVLFFRPLIRLLQADGHDVSITHARVRADARAARAARDRSRRRRAPHGGAGVLGKARALAGRLPALRRFAKTRALRPRPRARLARADPGGAEPRHPERDRARLRVRDAPAPARAARRDARRLPRRDPRRAPRPPRCATAEARPLSGDQGGVLPRRLRARSGRARRDRSGEGARRRAHAAGRLALPPARQPALRRRARAARPRRVRPRGRAASHSRATRGDSRARPPVAARPGARRRRPEPRRARRPHRLGRWDDEPRGRGARARPPTRRSPAGSAPSTSMLIAEGRLRPLAARKRARGAQAGRRRGPRTARSTHLARGSPFDTAGIRTRGNRQRGKGGFSACVKL